MMQRAFTPAYHRYTRSRPSPRVRFDDDTHDCGGNCGKPCCTGRDSDSDSDAPPRVQTAGGVWSRRTAGDVTPLDRACRGGAWRLANGRCPEDSQEGSSTERPRDTPGATTVPAGWDSMSREQQTTWLRNFGRTQGLSPDEQTALEERASAADRALIAGIINQGVSVVRTWLTTRSSERIAEIEAAARVEVARIQARAMGQGSLGPDPSQPPYVPPPYVPPPAPSSSVTEAVLPIALLLMFMK